MTGWDDLTSAALLGTARRTVDVAALPGPLGTAAGLLDTRDPAASLLDAAALAAPYRRAGGRPVAPSVEPGRAAPREEDPEIGPAAATRLGHLLAMPRGASERLLLVEWLGRAAAAGRAVPPQALPVLLDAATQDRELGDALAPVLGSRGRWLARFRADWERALTAATPVLTAQEPSDDDEPGDHDTVWASGTTADRRALFTRLRRSAPDLGRELLAGSWTRETLEDRQAFLDAMALAPSAADETLLEAALDDRRKGVRDRAVAVLRRLPGSAFARRTSDRARAVLLADAGPPGGTLTVAPPNGIDKAAARDGVSSKPPPGTGERAWWLHQIVAAAPLDGWVGATGLSLDHLVRAEVEGGWRDVLLAAWTDAAVAQQNGTWARALLGAGAGGPAAPALVGVLDPDDRAVYVAAAVGRRTPAPTTTQLLAACPGPWPDVLGDVMADAVAGWPARTPGAADDWTVREQLRLAAHRLPVRHAAAMSAAAARQPDDSPWRAALLAVSETLTFRHDMLEELQ